MSGTTETSALEVEGLKKPGVRPPIKLGMEQRTRSKNVKSPAAAQGYCQCPKKSIKLFQSSHSITRDWIP